MVTCNIFVKNILIMAKAKKYKTALVLSGGGARGLAHLGVIKALNEKDIFPDVIAGASAGALVATLYADGYTPDEIMAFFKEKELLKYVEIIIPKTSLVKMTGIIKMLNKYLRAKTFEELKIPVFIAASNISKGQIEYFSQGELLKPLVASASIPVLFNPVKINDDYYVDGGLLDNFPIKAIEKDAEKIIGVDVCPISYQDKFTSIKSVAIRSFYLAINRDVVVESQLCDLFIASDKLSQYGILDVKKNEEIFKLGYTEAKKALKTYNTSLLTD